MRRFDTTWTGEKRWSCGCHDPEGTRQNHSDSCIEKRFQSQRQRGTRSTKGIRVRGITYIDRCNGFSSTRKAYDLAKTLRRKINPSSPGVQESLEFYSYIND